MSVFEEKTFISAFDINAEGHIHVEKKTQIVKDNVVIATNNWRCVLGAHDPQAESVLGSEPYFYNLALKAWEGMPNGYAANAAVEVSE